jgi:hypothetical protein
MKRQKCAKNFFIEKKLGGNFLESNDEDHSCVGCEQWTFSGTCKKL